MMSRTDLEDMYHTCRWCKWFSDGKCINDRAFGGTEILSEAVYDIAEEGRLAGVLEETFGSVKASNLSNRLRDMLESYKLSGKRVSEVLELVAESLEEFLGTDCKEALDDAISRLYKNNTDNLGSGGVIIADPHSFYCKEFF